MFMKKLLPFNKHKTYLTCSGSITVIAEPGPGSNSTWPMDPILIYGDICGNILKLSTLGVLSGQNISAKN